MIPWVSNRSARVNTRQVSMTSESWITDGSPVQFFDVLNFVEIDPSRPQGDLVVSRNGRPASYIEPVLTGDQRGLSGQKTGRGGH